MYHGGLVLGLDVTSLIETHWAALVPFWRPACHGAVSSLPSMSSLDVSLDLLFDGGGSANGG